MARVIGKLTALEVERIKKAPAGERVGSHADGGGLYLHVTPNGAKSWLYCYMLRNRSREMGLGALSAVSLAEARQRAGEFRSLRAAGVDPIDARKAAQAKAQLEAARSITFKQAAGEFIEAYKPSWSNAKHANQWEATLATYVYPVFGAVAVAGVDTGMIIRVLEPIWSIKTETATRLRGRIERILDWSKVRGYRTGENPARWRGHLEHHFPARKAVQKVEHFPALPYAEVGAFMAKLREQEGIAALALELLILTVPRTGETIGAQWPEIDFESSIWTKPPVRMKGRLEAKREHRVPLSAPALAVLKRLHERKAGDFIFPGGKRGKPLSNMAMLALLDRMGYGHVTVHGFRSTFRDWAAECTNFPREVAEMALAHTISNEVEAAYRRGDLFQKRRQLMAAWGAWCTKPADTAGNVLAMRKAG